MARRKFPPPVLLFSLAFLLISIELVKAPFSRNGTQAVDRKVTFKEIMESKEEEKGEKESHENEEENSSAREKNGSEEESERKMAESHGREKTIKTEENVEEDPLIAVAHRDVKEIMGQFGDEAKEIGLQNGMEYALALFDGHFHFWCPNLEERPKKEIPYKNWQKNCNKWKSLWKPFKNWVQLLAIVEAEQPLDLDVNLMYLTVRPMLRKTSKSGENEEGKNLVVETIKAFIEIRTIKEGEKGEKKGGFTEREPPEWENQKEFEMVDRWAEYCKRQYYQNEKYGTGEMGRFKEAKIRLQNWLEKDRELLAGKKLMGGNGDARFGGNGVSGGKMALSADDPRFYGRPHYPPWPNYPYPRSHYTLPDHRQRPPHPVAEYRPSRPSQLYGNIPSDIQRRFRHQTYYSPVDDHFEQNNAPSYPDARKLPAKHFLGRKRHSAIYRGGWESTNHPMSMHMANGSRQLY